MSTVELTEYLPPHPHCQIVNILLSQLICHGWVIDRLSIAGRVNDQFQTSWHSRFVFIVNSSQMALQALIKKPFLQRKLLQSCYVLFVCIQKREFLLETILSLFLISRWVLKMTYVQIVMFVRLPKKLLTWSQPCRWGFKYSGCIPCILVIPP